jgi:hypothetical protein
MLSSSTLCSIRSNMSIFFCIWPLFLKKLRNESVQTYFHILALFSHASLVDASCALTLLMGQARVPLSTWPPRRPHSCQPDWCDSVTPTAVTRLITLFHRTTIESRHVRRREWVAPDSPSLSLSSSSLSFFLSSFSSIHLAATPLAISSSLP